MTMLVLDGSQGEGGGQILRTALGLSIVTGTPVRLLGIRGRRPKPGLMRQHLACVAAAQRVGGARVRGADLGSTCLEFEPKGVFPGPYEFAVGSAGSTTLVLQTILPALLMASGPSVVVVEGGTHNPMAPSFDYLLRVFLPVVCGMGPSLTLELERHGFHPAGGGRLTLRVVPSARLRPFAIADKGRRHRIFSRALVARIPGTVAQRELSVIQRHLELSNDDLEAIEIVESPGPGNVVEIVAEHQHISELIEGFGARGKPAEQVAEDALAEFAQWNEHPAPVGHHLADQLLIPMALAGSGHFITRKLSLHATTNMDIISRFLPGRFSCVEGAFGMRVDWIGGT